MEAFASLTEDNRKLITGVFDALARNNPRPFVDAMADNVVWVTQGSSEWSRVLEGKPAALEVLTEVRKQLASHIRLSVRRIIADGEHVVVEAKGQATTAGGKPYNNDYCFVYRIVGGKMVEVIEYLDTQLTCATFKPYWVTSPAA